VGTRYGISGPVDPPPGARAYVRSVLSDLRRLHDLGEFTSGGAWGIDTFGSLEALSLFPDAVHRLVLPAAAYNLELLKPGLAERFVVVRAPRGKTTAASYMLRNDLTVTHLDVLLAFPETRTEVQRSGTWSTVRRARRAFKDVRYFPLNEMS
jgi:hypothetical protein